MDAERDGMLARQIIESDSPLANRALIEQRAAIEELGGTLTSRWLTDPGWERLPPSRGIQVGGREHRG